MQPSFRVSVIAMLLIAVLLFQIPVYPAENPGLGGTRDDLVLRVALQDDIKTLNPLSADDVWTWDVIQWVLDTLVRRNASNNDHIEPWAAEWFHHGPENTWDTSVDYSDYDGSDDYRNWTVKLRNEIKWHDWANQTGDDRYVRAHDVIFSLRLMADVPRYYSGIDCLLARNPNGTVMYGRDLPTNGTIRLIGWDGETVRELPYWMDLSEQKAYPDLPLIYVKKDADDLTLHYFLTYDYVDFTTVTLKSYIFPERIWENHTADKLTWNDPECLINFGPFEFGYWNHSAESGRINTFRDYFRPEFDEKGRQKPYIDAIVFRVYGTTDAAVMALTSNEVDYIAWAIDPGFIDTIVKDPDLALVRNADLGFFYVAFNMRKPEFGYSGYEQGDLSNAPFGPIDYQGNYTDIGKPFRVAMAHLIDKQTIATKFLQGFGSIGTSVVSPVNSYWYNPNVKIYDYNKTKAAEILDEYAPDTDGDGIRELPYLGNSTITMLTPPADYDPICARKELIIESAAKSAGINFRSKPTNFGEIVNQINQHDFQMYMLGWSIPSVIGSINAPCDFFGSRSDILGGGYNYPGYHNRSFDRLCDEFIREPDMEKRKNLSYRMQQAIAEDVPYSVLYYKDVLEAYNKKFTGWVPRYGSIFNYDSLKNIRVSPPTDWEISISVPEKVEGGKPVNLDAYLYNKNTNEPIPDVEITFAVPSESTLNSTTDVTDASGKAEVTLTPVKPAGNTSISMTITASAYDKAADAPVESIKTILVIPPIPEKYKIELQFLNVPNSHIIAIDSDTPFDVQFRVINNKTGEAYGELVNGTGMEIQYSLSPASGSSFDRISFSNRTWTYRFMGVADIHQTTVYVVKITVTLKMNGTDISTTSDDLQFTVKGRIPPPPPPPPPPPQQHPENLLCLAVVIGGAVWGLVALILLAIRRHSDE